MALIFTDSEIQKISEDIILLPTIIDDPVNGTGLVQQRDNLQVVLDNLIETDGNNTVFSDEFIRLITLYHAELQQLNGDLKTDYDNADLLAGGANLPPHYPPGYPELNPVILDSNNGLPVTPNSIEDELDEIDDVNFEIDRLKNGYADGALDDTSTGAPAAGSVEVDDGGFSVGEIVVVDRNDVSFIAEIDAIDTVSVTTGTEVLEYTLISGTESTGIGSRVRNFHPGFSNAERGGQSVPYAPEVLAYWQSLLDAEVNEWESKLNAQETQLNVNDDVPEQANNSQALTDVQGALANILSWEALTVIDTNGKYTDSGLNFIESSIVDRTSEVPARVSQIATALGSASGTGRYFDLFTWVQTRISRAGGSLYRQASVDTGVQFFNDSIANNQALLDQYTTYFVVSQIIEDTELGQIEFEVEDASGYSPGNEVKVMDNDSVVYTRNIDTIIGNTIRLDSGIPAILAASLLARIVKQV